MNRMVVGWKNFTHRIREKINIDIFFYIAYTLIIFYYMSTNIKDILLVRSIALKVSYAILIFMIVVKIDTYSKKSIFILGSSTAIILISWLVCKTNFLLVIMLFIWAIKEIDLKKLINYSWKIKLFFLITVIILFFLNMTDNYTMYRDDGKIRMSMGLSHPNSFSSYIFSICAEFLYTYKSKINIAHFGVVMCFVCIIYFVADSRTTEIALIALGFLMMLLNVKKIRKIMRSRAFKYIVLSLFILLSVSSVEISKNYKERNAVIVTINDALSGRVRMAKVFLKKYEIKPFGNKIEIVNTQQSAETGVSTQVLDNAYVKILLEFGFLPYMLLLLATNSIFLLAYKRKNYRLCIVFIAFLFIGITENSFYKLSFNIFWLYVAESIFKDSEEVKLNMLGLKKCYIKFKRKYFYYRVFGKYLLNKRFHIKRQNKIDNKLELQADRDSDLRIGKDLQVKKNVSIRCRKGASLNIGSGVYFNNNCVLVCRKKIIIKDDVSIGPNVAIFDHDHDFRSDDRKNEFVCKPIYIGKNVWIGANACILKGSNIGDNCVIAAGAIVNKNIPGNSIYYSSDKIVKIQ